VASPQSLHVTYDEILPALRSITSLAAQIARVPDEVFEAGDLIGVAVEARRAATMVDHVANIVEVARKRTRR
jgi:hypothetical protein